MRRAIQWGAALAAVLLIAASLPVMWQVGSWALDKLRHGGAGDPVPIRTADLSGSGPGSLISAMTMPALTNSVERYTQGRTSFWEVRPCPSSLAYPLRVNGLMAFSASSRLMPSRFWSLP